jgi:hypothetical protein
LLYVLDESERHAVVFIDQANWRLFEVFAGEIEEIAGAFLDLSNEEAPPMPRPAERFVEGVTLRGGAAGDRLPGISRPMSSAFIDVLLRPWKG